MSAPVGKGKRLVPKRGEVSALPAVRYGATQLSLRRKTGSNLPVGKKLSEIRLNGANANVLLTLLLLRRPRLFIKVSR